MPQREREHLIVESACFDLECTSLNADFGIILCAVVKPAGGNPTTFRLDELSKQWDGRRSYDYPVVKAIVTELESYDVLAGHNAVKFDLPFLRTRMAKYQMKPLRKFKVIDPLQILRNQFRLSYNSLDRATAFLGCNTKSPVDGDMWLRAALDGSRRAMNYIVAHCIEDVRMLEKEVLAVKGYSTTFNGWGSAY
jgi:DNA polymerase III epsilon subunit-like protein